MVTQAGKKRLKKTARREGSLFPDLHTFPEGDITSNLLGGFLWLGVNPGGIPVGVFPHAQGILTGRSFPGTDAGFLAVNQIFIFDRLRRKIVIPFDENGLIRFGNDLFIPDGFHGFCSFP